MVLLLNEKLHFNGNFFKVAPSLKSQFFFRMPHENIILLLLNICVLEKLCGKSFRFFYQKKNIRTFAPVGSIIGASFYFKHNFFLNNYLNYWLSKTYVFFEMTKAEKNYIQHCNNFSSFIIKEPNFLSFSYLKLNRSNWDTLSYLYDKEKYGLEISIFFSKRNVYINRLILSQYNMLMYS